MSTIKVKSSDGEIFTVDVDVAKVSLTIKTMLEDLCVKGDEEQPVTITNVSSEILKKVIEFCEFHKNDPPPPKDDGVEPKRSDDLSTWDIDFLRVDRDTLFALANAGHYLKIQGLKDATGKTVANMIKGKTAEEMRRTFSAENDIEPELE